MITNKRKRKKARSTPSVQEVLTDADVNEIEIAVKEGETTWKKQQRKTVDYITNCILTSVSGFKQNREYFTAIQEEDVLTEREELHMESVKVSQDIAPVTDTLASNKTDNTLTTKSLNSKDKEACPISELCLSEQDSKYK